MSTESFITDKVLLDALTANRWTVAPFTQAGDWWRCEDSATLRPMGSGATPRAAITAAIQRVAQQ